MDEPLPHEVDEQEQRRLELRRQARENAPAVALLTGMKFK